MRSLSRAKLALRSSVILLCGKELSNSYTIICPPVRGDNSQALARGLSPLQVDKP